MSEMARACASLRARRWRRPVGRAMSPAHPGRHARAARRLRSNAIEGRRIGLSTIEDRGLRLAAAPGASRASLLSLAMAASSTGNTETSRARNTASAAATRLAGIGVDQSEAAERALDHPPHIVVEPARPLSPVGAAASACAGAWRRENRPSLVFTDDDGAAAGEQPAIGQRLDDHGRIRMGALGRSGCRSRALVSEKLSALRRAKASSALCARCRTAGAKRERHRERKHAQEAGTGSAWSRFD